MTFVALLIAAYAAFSVATRTYPAAVGETLSHGGRPITPRGALLFAAAVGAIVFALIATPLLVIVPTGA